MPEALRPDQDPRQQLRAAVAERVTEQLGWLQEAAQMVGGPEAKVADVFDVPTVVRDDAPMPDWSRGQIEAIRAIGRRFGYGAEKDVPSGLDNALHILEGGKVWKILAEAEASRGENPHTIMFSGSPDRPLGPDELEFMEKIGMPLPTDSSEYDAAYIFARQYADKSVADEPITLDFGYEVAEGNRLLREPTGQVKFIGETLLEQSVQLFRVDREDYQAEDGSPKFRYRPDTMRVMTLNAEILKAQGGTKISVALGTSSTYASRQVSAIRAGLQVDAEFGVSMYGRETVVGLGAPVPKEMPLNHLPGDLRRTNDELMELQAELRIS